MSTLTATFDTVLECQRLAAERDRFLRELAPYPGGKFAGRAAVILGEGRYEPGVYVAVQMLRRHGFPDPVYVWHGPEGLSDRVRGLPGVECVDRDAALAAAGRRMAGCKDGKLRAWSAKLFAVIECPAEEVLFLDADAYVVRDPAPCFDPKLVPSGWLAWADTEGGDKNLKWEAHFLRGSGRGVNGGQYAVRKAACWRALNVAAWVDDRMDFYHGNKFAYGDQDSPRVAWAATGEPGDVIDERPDWVGNAAVNRGPDGPAPMIVHRISNKFGPASCGFRPRCAFQDEIPGEAEAWHAYLGWMTSAA